MITNQLIFVLQIVWYVVPVLRLKVEVQILNTKIITIKPNICE